MMESSLKHRNLAGGPMIALQYTEPQQTALQILELIFSFLGIVSTTYTVFWFLAMRRSFRHHLVMILIQSNMFKALWYWIFAIAAFVPGAVDSSSMLCQIIGFFSTIGLEMVDFTVLIIAVHTALCIFRPPVAIGEIGLYPYRYIAYILLLVLPFLMAGLAFINPTTAYVVGGGTCRLPLRPFWYQLALNWIPRYLIVLIILGIDASIYLYIRYKFKDFDESINPNEQTSTTLIQVQKRQGRDSAHGSDLGYTVLPLIPLPLDQLRSERRHPLLLPCIGLKPVTPNEPRRSSPEILSGSFPMKGIKSNAPCEVSQNATHSDLYRAVPHIDCVKRSSDISTHGTTTIAPSLELDCDPIQSVQPNFRASWTTSTAHVNPSFQGTLSPHDILCTTETRVSFTARGLIIVPPPEISTSIIQDFNNCSIRQTRRRIKRQLRHLFLYPLVYVAMWIVPFASHVLQYNDYYVKNPPFVLTACVVVLTLSQSTIDCLIFSIKEKPWRQSTKEGQTAGRLSFLQDLKTEWMPSFWQGGVKRRSVMAEDARLAYQRRAQEREARESHLHNKERSEERERSWWDEAWYMI